MFEFSQHLPGRCLPVSLVLLFLLGGLIKDACNNLAAAEASPGPPFFDCEWTDHRIRRVGGLEADRWFRADHAQLTRSWNRVVAVPSLVWIPQRKRLLMTLSCDYPHRPMVIWSDDLGTRWTQPRPMLPPDPGNPRHLLAVAPAWIEAGNVIAGVEGRLRCFSSDYGENWRFDALPPLPGGGNWNQWDPCLVERSADSGKVELLIETGYEQHGHADSQAYIRTSKDDGKSWTPARKVDTWKNVNEVALVKAANGDYIAACRTIIPESKKGETLDHFEGLGISISRDRGATWSKVEKLYDWGRHHPSMLVLPDSRIVMTYVVRKGYTPTTNGYPQFGIEAVISRDHGRSWDLDHRYVLQQWAGHIRGPNQWWPSSQSTSTVLLPDGRLMTAYGTGYRCQPNAQGMPAPRDVGLVRWRLDDSEVDTDRRMRDSASDSERRNVFDPAPDRR